MTYLVLKLRKELKYRINLGLLTPNKIVNKKISTIKSLKITYGKEKKEVSNFFSISGNLKKGIIFKGNLNRCDFIGNEMVDGKIIVKGDAGDYLGNKMKGGKIIVNGSSSNYTGSSLKNGEILVTKNTGDFLGSSIQGEKLGMSGGTIIIKGNAGHRVGYKMRSGVICIKKNVKDFAGCQMIAGTIIIKGKIGSNIGLLMKRGTIILEKQKLSQSYLNYNGKNNYIFLKVIESYLEKLNDEFKDIFPNTYIKKYLGDINCKGMGEILILN
ncbi:MAG: formylmethanofuran dehydrogenase subunit C [Pelagibacteraceae bacterium]|nr:formylmethanofuran dehydrogenase subunit C [Pelagibacteraceae bacterium]